MILSRVVFLVEFAVVGLVLEERSIGEFICISDLAITHGSVGGRERSSVDETSQISQKKWAMHCDRRLVRALEALQI